jgi:NAD(P)-dependent dehydrogenase (short-subunit alcohol dehydrogenase family)
MVCRNRTKGETIQNEIKAKSGNNAVDLLIADLSSQQSIRELAESFKKKYQQLHILINNAGNVFPRRSLTVDGIEQTFALNHLAPFLLTNLLIDLLKASAPARVVNVASGAQGMNYFHIDDLQSEKHYRMMQVYSQSKIANILFTYQLAKRLEGTGVTANCLHPGFVATNIGSSNLPTILLPLLKIITLVGVKPEEGAKTSLYLATSPEVENITGKYFDKFKEVPTVKVTYDPSAQESLWDISIQLTNLPVTV